MESMMFGAPVSENSRSTGIVSIPGTDYLRPCLLGRDEDNNSKKLKFSEHTHITITSVFASPWRDYALQSTMEVEKNSVFDGAVVNTLIDKELGDALFPITYQNIQQNSSSCIYPLNDNYLLSYCGENSGENWVTVYGFPASMLSIVLSYFSQCGTIINKKNHLNSGNWIHIKYSSKHEVDEALLRNGKMVTPNLMVGVVLCNKPDDPIIDALVENKYVKPIIDISVQGKSIFTKAMDFLFRF